MPSTRANDLCNQTYSTEIAMSRLPGSFALRVVIAVLLAVGFAQGARADTKTWTGAVNSLWSTPGNWTGGVPAAGDRIVFGASGANRTNTNDLPAGTAFFDITFLGNNYVLSGNNFALTDGISSNTAPNTINNNIQALGPQTMGGAYCCGPLILNGTLDLGANQVTFNYQVQANGAISGTGGLTLGDVITLTGTNTYTGPTTIQQRAEIDGQQPSSAVSTATWYNATLSGTGRTGSVALNGASYIQPGSSFGGAVGQITTGSLTLNASSYVYAQLNGTSAGATYDQVKVAGTVTIDPAASLLVQLGYTPSVGQSFVIVDNDGTDPVSGTFSGLPEGGTISQNANELTVSYVGGSGNDIVLTVTAAAKTWTGAASNLWSNPGNWLGGVPGPGDPLVFPSGAANQTNINDLAPGTTFKLILFSGSGYTISGNPVQLSNGISSTAAPNTFNPDITLTAPQTMGGAICCGPLNLGGNIALGANLLTFDYQVNATGKITGTAGLAIGDVVTLTGLNAYTGPTTIQQRAEIDGVQPASAVSTINFYNGTVSGKGTLGTLTMNGGSIQPGQSFGGAVGRLSTGDVTMNSGTMFVAQINGIVPGVRHDQLSVTGTVTISSGVNLAVNLGYTPSLGQSYVLIDNDGADPINGTFNGLPEGSILNINQNELYVSYVGGDGNDCELSVVSVAKTWTGAVSNLWSDPGNWLGGVPGPGDPLVFPAGAANLTNTNDLAPGTVFKLILFSGSNYQISGNPFGLSEGISSTTAPNTIANDLQITAAQTIGGAYCCGPLNLTGTISLGSNLLTFNYMINATGIISGSGGLALGDVITLSGNNTYTGPTTISQRGQIDGVQPVSPVSTVNYYNSTVSGRGRTGTITTNSGSYISPGQNFGGSPGKLSSGSVTMNASSYFSAQLNGSVPGAGYDQLNVIGSVTIDGAASLFPNLGFTPALGQVFVLVNNDGNDPVSGAFNGMPQGATFNIGPYPFQISYIGKTGNDITLTSLSGDLLNGAPVAVNDSYSTPFNIPLTVAAPGVLGNDSDPDLQPLTVVLSDTLSSQGGVVTVGATGGFTYTPPTGFNGTDTFIYIISDGNDATDLATVTITVAPDPAGIGPVAVSLPTKFELFAPQPNPSRGNVEITFGQPQAGPVRADIFDAAGRRVAQLAADAAFAPGYHTLAWDGRNASGSRAGGGIYFLRVSSGGHTELKKLVLLAP
jgi:hypothetical protein